MTDTIRALWAAVAQHPCPYARGRHEEKPHIDAQRAYLGRLVDAYQDAGDETRGLFLAKLLDLPPQRVSRYVFHLWGASATDWTALGLSTDGDVYNSYVGRTPEECFEKLFENPPTDL